MPIPKTTGSRSFKIFIGGVAQGTTEDDLKNFFQTFGPVSARTPPPSSVLLAIGWNGGKSLFCLRSVALVTDLKFCF
jgi:RNA recognition motif-containing protein